MKTNQNERTENNVTIRPNLAQRCADSWRKLIAQLGNTKQAILAEFRSALGAHEQLLRLALNEAEALAWQTEYPHLVFPALAIEKAQSVTAWHQRQRALARNAFAPA